MPTKQIVQVDAFTGEILEGATLAVHYPKRTNGFQTGGWMALAQNPALTIAQNRTELGLEALAMLLYAVHKLDYENLLVLNQTEAAKTLNMKQPSVSRALSKLVTAGILLQGPKISGRNTYRMNPSFGWKGSAKNHRDALAERIKEARLSVIEGGKADKPSAP